tara:strand:+ start:617 stop:760 length:144 start_codon:yes stop_codon:yes gene_type:complete
MKIQYWLLFFETQTPSRAEKNSQTDNNLYLRKDEFSFTFSWIIFLLL